MKKTELEYQQTLSFERKFTQVVELIKLALTISGYLYAIYLIFDGLHLVLSGQSPEGISAISKVLEALNLGTILSLVWGGGMTAAWWRERNGKKRAITEKAKYQAIAEQDDAGGRASSGLTNTGETPVQESA